MHSQSKTSADACTPLRSLMLSATVADSVGADFKKGTWTFKVAAHQPAQAGQYMLVPVILAQLAADNEAAQHTTGLLPLAELSARFRRSGSDTCLEAEYPNGSDAYTLYRTHCQPEKYGEDWHPAHWYGCIHYQGTDSEQYTGPYRTYVQNDFGDLVQVPA